ncbi:ribosome silencing factor [Acidicapsa acidisoli]|uniref:ribosome silencing factor n=1 Tax=Acidicapsa acidisoli TaxID=1615681 RepID=UPI0021DF8C93|nr:ribosome silencing factor [Acidicapsa acidisoli]
MATPETRRQLLVAVAACDDKKGEDTRILELDPADSGLADFFLITSATNDRQVVAIADEIELRLKKDFGLYATSVEGRRQAEWILLDYTDIVIHVFLAEKRAFYDIERLRKSARNLTSAEVEAELAHALAEKTRAVRSSSSKAAKKSAKVAPGKSPATKATKPKSPSANTSNKGDSTVTAKPAKKAVKKAAAKPAKAVKANSTAKTSTPKVVAKPALKLAAKPAKKAAATPVGVLAPTATGIPGKEFADNLGAKPPILKCEDPDAASSVSIAASAAPKPAKTAPKKAAKKAPVKAAAKKSKGK